MRAATCHDVGTGVAILRDAGPRTSFATRVGSVVRDRVGGVPRPVQRVFLCGHFRNGACRRVTRVAKVGIHGIATGVRQTLTVVQVTLGSCLVVLVVILCSDIVQWLGGVPFFWRGLFGKGYAFSVWVSHTRTPCGYGRAGCGCRRGCRRGGCKLTANYRGSWHAHRAVWGGKRRVVVWMRGQAGFQTKEGGSYELT